MARIKKTKSKQKVGKQRRTRKRVTRRLRGGGLFSKENTSDDLWLDVGYPHLLDLSKYHKNMFETMKKEQNYIINTHFERLLYRYRTVTFLKKFNINLKLKSVDTNTNKETVYGTLDRYDSNTDSLIFKGVLTTKTIPMQTFKKIIEDKTEKLQYSLPFNAKIQDFPNGWTKCDSVDSCFKKGRFYVTLKPSVGDQITRNDLDDVLGQLYDVEIGDDYNDKDYDKVTFHFDTDSLNTSVEKNRTVDYKYNNTLKTYHQKLAFKD